MSGCWSRHAHIEEDLPFHGFAEVVARKNYTSTLFSLPLVYAHTRLDLFGRTLIVSATGTNIIVQANYYDLYAYFEKSRAVEQLTQKPVTAVRAPGTINARENQELGMPQGKGKTGML